MSLLADPPALIADGESYARLMPESAQGGGAAVAATAYPLWWWLGWDHGPRAHARAA
jgi:hypothetical protein